MKKKTPKKLHLYRETVGRLGSDQLSQAAGGATTTQYLQACSNPCHTDLCNGNDTAQSCNVFSCQSCILAGCTSATAPPQ
jgi:hypothetical protein